MFYWEITIPAKIEYKLYQACILIGIDILDEYIFWFSDYTILAKSDYRGLYADFIIICDEQLMMNLYKKLAELGANNADMWILDEVCEEIEEENESWQNQ